MIAPTTHARNPAYAMSDTQTFFESHFPGRRSALKREVLQTALSLFNEQGIEATTIDQIKTRCETSVGAIYHHFGNKEGLVAALFFVSQDAMMQLTLTYLEKASTVQGKITAVVQGYIDWVTEHPELARFQFQARTNVAKSGHSDALAAKSKARNRALLDSLTPAERNELLKIYPPDLILSLIIGPAESYCRAWLAGRVKKSPAHYRELLAQAVWKSLS